MPTIKPLSTVLEEAHAFEESIRHIEGYVAWAPDPDSHKEAEDSLARLRGDYHLWLIGHNVYTYSLDEMTQVYPSELDPHGKEEGPWFLWRNESDGEENPLFHLTYQGGWVAAVFESQEEAIEAVKSYPLGLGVERGSWLRDDVGSRGRGIVSQLADEALIETVAKNTAGRNVALAKGEPLPPRDEALFYEALDRGLAEQMVERSRALFREGMGWDEPGADIPLKNGPGPTREELWQELNSMAWSTGATYTPGEEEA